MSYTKASNTQNPDKQDVPRAEANALHASGSDRQKLATDGDMTASRPGAPAPVSAMSSKNAAGGPSSTNRSGSSSPDLNHLRGYKEVPGGIVPKSATEAARATTRSSVHSAPKRLDGEDAAHRDEWGGDETEGAQVRRKGFQTTPSKGGVPPPPGTGPMHSGGLAQAEDSTGRPSGKSHL